MGDESMQQAKEMQQQQSHSRLLARGWLAVGKALTTLSSTMLPDRAQYVDRVGRLSVTNGLGACHANCHFLSRSAQSAGGVNPGVIQLGTKGRVLLWSGSMLCPHNVHPLIYGHMPVHSNVPQHAVIMPGVPRDCRIAGYVI